MKKIMFITNRLPFPNTDGRKNILLQYLNQIKEIYPECSITNLSFIDDERYMKDQPSAISRLVSLELPRMGEKLFNLLIYTLLLRRWPLQVSVFYSRKNHKQIKRIIEEEKPEIIFYDMVRVAEYITKGDENRILSYDDLLSLRYMRQLQWYQYIPSIFGGFSDRLPKSIKHIGNMKLIQKWIITFESKLLRKYERKVAKKFDHLIFTSPKEANSFKQSVQHPSCHGIPMSFDPEKNKIGGMRSYDRNKIVFVGKMDIPHNSSAVVYFCEHIWPKVKKHSPEVKFYIVGKNPTTDVYRLQQHFPDVFVTGEVEDVKQFISDSALMIAPLLFGTGIKTKIVEAMSWGVPVVTNSIGSEGINAKNHEDIFICETDEEIVQDIVLLLKNEDLNNKISSNSIRNINQNFSSSKIRKKFELILS